MRAKKILSSDIAELKVSSLPTKPTAPKSMGGKGYGAKEMKEAFDKLPLFIIERFNALIEDILATGTDSLSAAIGTGIKEDHTLCDMFGDVGSGEFAAYLKIFDESLVSHITCIRTELERLDERLRAIETARGEEDNA